MSREWDGPLKRGEVEKEFVICHKCGSQKQKGKIVCIGCLQPNTETAYYCGLTTRQYESFKRFVLAYKGEDLVVLGFRKLLESPTREMETRPEPEAPIPILQLPEPDPPQLDPLPKEEPEPDPELQPEALPQPPEPESPSEDALPLFMEFAPPTPDPIPEGEEVPTEEALKLLRKIKWEVE